MNMREEKLNNEWKQKLEDTSSLQNFVLQNKDAGWGKLHSRLEKKPQKKRVVWYWIAAACLLIAATIPFIKSHHTNDVAQHSFNK